MAGSAMSTPRRLIAIAVLAGAGLGGFAVLSAKEAPAPERPSLGRKASAEEIARWELTVTADGEGLPAGSGSAAQGAMVFAERCQACHGENGAGGPADRLTGGVGSLAGSQPIRTPASYWPYAPPLFDYIRRAMPHDAPQSLTADQTYAVVAYLLSVDGVVRPDAVLDATSLRKVVMPNRDGFVSLEARGFDGNLERIAGAPAPIPRAIRR